MNKKIDVKLIFNKVNGQCNLALPKRKLSPEMRNKLKNSKRARISLEDLYE